MSTITNQMFNFPIYELAGITKQIYDDGSECFHFEVGYLLDVNDSEVVINVYPTTKEQLLMLPMITPSSQVSVMQQRGNTSTCINQLQVGDL
jgi:hypothetical protein